MSFYDDDNLRAAMNGRWLARPGGGLEPVGVGTDTRGDLAGRVFVALRGPRHDGHDHLAAARERGAVLAVVDREPDPAGRPPGLGLLLVSDTRRALGRLALAWRRSLAANTVIAVTGSSGKTTTKALIHALLGTTFTGTAAPKSFNNDVGVPLTILAASHGERYLIVEVGSSEPGEIARLAAIVEPDIAVITSVGRAHLERFGSVEAVAREKASLIAHQRTTGIGFVNADAPALPRRWPGGPTVVRFGEHEDADLRLTARGPRKYGGWWFEVNGRTRFDLALPGRHNAINALAAVGIGRRFGLSDEAMSAALGTVRPEPMRMSREVVGGGDGIEVYNDAYNANPDSMAAALETFVEAAAAAPRRVVVLGDMLELGDEAPALHRELGRAVVDADSRCEIAHVVIVGAFAADVAGEIRRVWPASRVTVRRRLDAAAIRAASRRVQPGDAVLVKASRGVGLERLVAALQGAGDH